jgi:hypothetical protein
MTTTPTLPSRKISFTLKVKDVEQEYSISYPSIGEQIDIETLKANLTRGMYGAISSSQSNIASKVLLQIDAIATLNILCPDLKKDLKVEGLTTLAEEDFLPILSTYIRVILPWINEWDSVLSKAVESIGSDSKA